MIAFLTAVLASVALVFGGTSATYADEPNFQTVTESGTYSIPANTKLRITEDCYIISWKASDEAGFRYWYYKFYDSEGVQVGSRGTTSSNSYTHVVLPSGASYFEFDSYSRGSSTCVVSFEVPIAAGAVVSSDGVYTCPVEFATTNHSIISVKGLRSFTVDVLAHYWSSSQASGGDCDTFGLQYYDSEDEPVGDIIYCSTHSPYLVNIPNDASYAKLTFWGINSNYTVYQFRLTRSSLTPTSLMALVASIWAEILVVGGAIITFATSNWLVLIACGLFVLIAGLNIIDKFKRG